MRFTAAMFLIASSLFYSCSSTKYANYMSDIKDDLNGVYESEGRLGSFLDYEKTKIVIEDSTAIIQMNRKFKSMNWSFSDSLRPYYGKTSRYSDSALVFKGWKNDSMLVFENDKKLYLSYRWENMVVIKEMEKIKIELGASANKQ